MCGICGCGHDDHQHGHGDKEGHTHSHQHDHHHHHDSSKLIDIQQDIMTVNQQHADQNRQYFKQNNILALNLVSSPGSGKTTLLEASLAQLAEQLPLAVLEGDQQTDRDAQRIAATGARVLQINTGTVCHLDAHRIQHAVDELQPVEGAVLFIENVGNLVCPALFDLGESQRVVLLSVTEGDDKPLKYPHMFRGADLMIVNKVDLLPYVDFDLKACVDYARQVNPGIEVIELSATKGDGVDLWLQWLLNKAQHSGDALLSKA